MTKKGKVDKRRNKLGHKRKQPYSKPKPKIKFPFDESYISSNKFNKCKGYLNMCEKAKE